MTNQHPITPPPELVQQWCLEAEDEHNPKVVNSLVSQLATQAAQWGADQELEACCYWLADYGWKGVANLRAALAEQPVGPTDEEIMELMPQQMRDDLAAAARALAGFVGPKASTAYRIILNRHAVDHVRAVLSRYAHQ